MLVNIKVQIVEAIESIRLAIGFFYWMYWTYDHNVPTKITNCIRLEIHNIENAVFAFVWARKVRLEMCFIVVFCYYDRLK